MTLVSDTFTLDFVAIFVATNKNTEVLFKFDLVCNTLTSMSATVKERLNKLHS